jgi:hypothetical protein
VTLADKTLVFLAMWGAALVLLYTLTFLAHLIRWYLTRRQTRRLHAKWHDEGIAAFIDQDQVKEKDR